jgi:PII-like signaling protein
MVVEIVDGTAALERFLDSAAPMLEGHPVLVTLEHAHVVHYRGGESRR